jgi:hypothetical protein
MIQAFVVDATSLAVAQRLKVPTLGHLQRFPLTGNQSIVVYEGEEDIEAVEPQAAGGVVSFVPRVVNPATLLASAKNSKKAAINAKRDQLWSGACQTPKGPVNCDAVSRINITGAVVGENVRGQLGMPTTGTNWTMADNRVVFHNLLELRTMGITVAQFIEDVQTLAKTLKDQVDAATTLAEVEAINPEGVNWPT